MSEREKRVIHVKDLVIKADNVYVERPHHRRRDPFFGFPREREEDRESSDERHHHGKRERDQDDDDRRPFSWL